MLLATFGQNNLTCKNPQKWLKTKFDRENVCNGEQKFAISGVLLNKLDYLDYIVSLRQQS